MSILTIKCEKCGHKRIARKENPLKCSRCGHIPGTQIRNKIAVAAQGLTAQTATAPNSTNNDGGTV